MAGTFISYRREDSAGYAGRLRESLERRMGVARVFRDVDTLTPGQDFVQAIDDRLAQCRVLLAVIGREWLDAKTAAGTRRLDDPYDFVRLEIAAALKRQAVLVIPVLVEGVSMPAAADLPEDIRPLARRHAVSVRDETWDADVDRLVGVIEGVEPAVRHSTPAVAAAAPGRGSAIAAVLVVVALAVAGFVLFSARGDSPSASTTGVGSAAGGPAASGAVSPTGANSEPAGFTPYTIDIPRVAEVAYRELIYSVVSGNVHARETTNELRIRIRALNNSSTPANFWDRSFRLTIDGADIVPTSDLNEVLDGHSLRYGVVAFPIPRRAGKAILHILDGTATSDVPLDLAPTGRPPVDDKAEIADSQGQAILRGVIGDQTPLLQTGEMQVVLVRATTRRFANTLRLIVSFRATNRGRYPAASGSITMRVEEKDVLVAPWQFPSDVIDPMSSYNGTAMFDLPTSLTSATLRTSLGSDTGTPLPLSLQ